MLVLLRSDNADYRTQSSINHATIETFMKTFEAIILFTYPETFQKWSLGMKHAQEVYDYIYEKPWRLLFSY